MHSKAIFAIFAGLTVGSRAGPIAYAICQAGCASVVLEIDLQGSSMYEAFSDELKRREDQPRSTMPQSVDAQPTQPSETIIVHSFIESATTHRRPVAPTMSAVETAKAEHAHLRRHRQHGRS
jgi:hypothetical protein